MDFGAKRLIYGSSAPGFVINMPLFALALRLELGIFKTVIAFLFLSVATINFLMIFDNAKKRDSGGQEFDDGRKGGVPDGGREP
jgi:hypothetical protein